MTIGNLIGYLIFWGIIGLVNVVGYTSLMENNNVPTMENRIFIVITVALDIMLLLVLLQWFINTKLGMSVCNNISKFLNKKIF